MDDVQATVKAYILAEFLPDANPDDLTSATRLIEDGILDSLATVRLVAHLEREFGIAVEIEEVNVENLGTLDRIAAFIRGKLKDIGKARV